MTINYINTDLDIESNVDLTDLASILGTRGLHCLHLARGGDGRWQARFETDNQYTDVEGNIGAMLDAIEGLRGSGLEAWRACDAREFNVGYKSGFTPRVFEQGLTNIILRRIVDVGARVGISIYPTAND